MVRQPKNCGRDRARIAPLLTGEDLAELLALAEFSVICGGSFHFQPPQGTAKRLMDLGLVERVRTGIARGPHARRLTQLGWLTLLTRAEAEMAHLFPAHPEAAHA